MIQMHADLEGLAVLGVCRLLPPSAIHRASLFPKGLTMDLGLGAGLGALQISPAQAGSCLSAVRLGTI